MIRWRCVRRSLRVCHFHIKIDAVDWGRIFFMCIYYCSVLILFSTSSAESTSWRMKMRGKYGRQIHTPTGGLGTSDFNYICH